MGALLSVSTLGRLWAEHHTSLPKKGGGCSFECFHIRVLMGGAPYKSAKEGGGGVLF